MEYNSPRVMIAGAHSDSGKSTITMGLLLALKDMGLNPQSFKAGPDYLDPMHHTMVLGRECRNLDTWMFPDGVKDAFMRGTEGAGISVIEGVMGLYDGVDGMNESGSSAHLSKILNTPVILVIDAKGMSRSAGAVAMGFKEYDKETNIAGVIFNRVGSRTHLEMLKASLKGIECLGGVTKDDCMILESRHLGLVPAGETYDSEKYEKISAHVRSCLDVDAIVRIANSAGSLDVPVPRNRCSENRVRIGVARDPAFNFYYVHNMEDLINAGAELVPFSPIADELPDVDGLYLGGGYPEIYAPALEKNKDMRKAVKKASDDGMPIYAECGGLMFLCAETKDLKGDRYEMCGVFDAYTTMSNNRMVLGYVDTVSVKDSVICEKGWTTRGHEFHYSTIVPAGNEKYAFESARGKGIADGKDGIVEGNTLAGYLHIHFASNPKIPVRFVESCARYRRN
jgi:cobyrinic acid a,c-diamide synthase